MSANATTVLPHRCRWRMRFSLRTLLIVVTVLCLTVAPLLPELNREREVARQVKLIEEMGGQCVFVHRPASVFTHLVRFAWPVRLKHLDHDLLMAEFTNKTIDLAKLAQAPAVRGVCFSECRFIAANPAVRCPQVEYVQLRQSLSMFTYTDLTEAVPACFCRMRKAHLSGMPQHQELFDGLGQCTRLEELELHMAPYQAQKIDIAPLGHLPELVKLKVSGTSGVQDWSCLSRLQNLEDVEIGSTDAGHVDLTSLGGVTHQVQADRTPSYALGKLTRLRHVRVHQVKIPVSDIRALADANALQSFYAPGIAQSVPFLPQSAALKELCNEPSLRAVERIRVETKHDRQEVLAILSDARQLREVSIWFLKLDDEMLERLAELSHVLRWSLSFDADRAVVSAQGLAVFQKLPIVELQYQHTAQLSLGKGVQELLDDWQSRKPPDTPHRENDEGLEFLTQLRK